MLILTYGLERKLFSVSRWAEPGIFCGEYLIKGGLGDREKQRWERMRGNFLHQRYILSMRFCSYERRSFRELIIRRYASNYFNSPERVMPIRLIEGTSLRCVYVRSSDSDLCWDQLLVVYLISAQAQAMSVNYCYYLS